jgi:hypothetical protein
VADTLINNTKALEDYIVFLRASFDKHKAIKVSVKSAKTRTLTQNSSIHKYCAQLAEAFNDAGLDMETILKKGVAIPWDEHNVKKLIWHEVQFPMTGKKSSKDLLTNEVSKVYNVVNRHLSQTFGVFVPFPSRDNYGS